MMTPFEVCTLQSVAYLICMLGTDVSISRQQFFVAKKEPTRSRSRTLASVGAVGGNVFANLGNSGGAFISNLQHSSSNIISSLISAFRANFGWPRPGRLSSISAPLLEANLATLAAGTFAGSASSIPITLSSQGCWRTRGGGADDCIARESEGAVRASVRVPSVRRSGTERGQSAEQRAKSALMLSSGNLSSAHDRSSASKFFLGLSPLLHDP